MLTGHEWMQVKFIFALVLLFVCYVPLKEDSVVWLKDISVLDFPLKQGCVLKLSGIKVFLISH
jgi:hypothetical protein